MSVQKIPVNRIGLPKVNPKIRTLNKQAAVDLASSIEIDGLLQPVLLRPDPGSPGRYLLVCGRHRLHAVAKVLGRESIDAIVRDDLDEAAAERLALAGNIFQFPLTKVQRSRAVMEHFRARQALFERPDFRLTASGWGFVARDGQSSHGEGTSDGAY